MVNAYGLDGEASIKVVTSRRLPRWRRGPEIVTPCRVCVLHSQSLSSGASAIDRGPWLAGLPRSMSGRESGDDWLQDTDWKGSKVKVSELWGGSRVSVEMLHGKRRRNFLFAA